MYVYIHWHIRDIQFMLLPLLSEINHRSYIDEVFELVELLFSLHLRKIPHRKP